MAPRLPSFFEQPQEVVLAVGVRRAGRLVEFDPNARPVGDFQITIDNPRDAVEQIARPGRQEVVEALLDQEVRQAGVAISNL